MSRSYIWLCSFSYWLKAAFGFSFVVCCLPVRIQFLSDHIGISSGGKRSQDFHGIICDRIKLCYLWSQSQPESTRSCLQRNPSILPLSLEASEQWDSHSLFGTVAALSWPGALLLLGGEGMRQSYACSWAEPACRSALRLTGALQLWTTACCFRCSIFSLIFSIWPTMTYKDRHKPGFELWGVWCENASKSHSRTYSHGRLPLHTGEKETFLKLVCKAFSHIKDLSHSAFKCLKRLCKICLWMSLDFSM